MAIWMKWDRVWNENVWAMMKTALMTRKQRTGNPYKTRQSTHKVGPRLEATRKASERSTKEEMEGRCHEKSRRSWRQSRRRS